MIDAFESDDATTWEYDYSTTVLYPNPPDVEIPIPMKIEPCAYCGSRCVADYLGNCRACGAPKGN